MPKRKDPPILTSEQTREEFERILSQEPDKEIYVFVLYITGTTARSTQAVAAIRALCEEYLTGRYDLDVVDIYQNPERLAADQIVAAPTLLKTHPVPAQRFVGNLADTERVLLGLNLKSHSKVKWIEL